MFKYDKMKWRQSSFLSRRFAVFLPFHFNNLYTLSGPADSNNFCTCTLTCWTLFMRIQIWKEKNRYKSVKTEACWEKLNLQSYEYKFCFASCLVALIKKHNLLRMVNWINAIALITLFFCTNESVFSQIRCHVKMLTNESNWLSFSWAICLFANLTRCLIWDRH